MYSLPSYSVSFSLLVRYFFYKNVGRKKLKIKTYKNRLTSAKLITISPCNIILFSFCEILILDLYGFLLLRTLEER
jgi:hypothetical protein